VTDTNRTELSSKNLSAKELFGRAFGLLREGTEVLFKGQNVELQNVILIELYNDQLMYAPSELRVEAKVDTTVRWASTVGPFTISALGISPFSGVQFHSEPTADGSHVAEATVPSTTTSGTYRYAIALDTPKGIYVDPSCPPIIVE
jgi:hypothetical protein